MPDDETRAVTDVHITRFHGGDGYPADDIVAREDALEVRLNGTPLVYLMRLPGHDRELAAGFLASEGLILGEREIELLRECPEDANVVDVVADVTGGGVDRFDVARVVRTGCGGADLSKEIDLSGIRVQSDARFSPSVIARTPDRLLAEQEVFRTTGGTHGAAVFDTGGNLLAVREDVGRHNAVDKAIGHLLLAGEPPGDKGLVLSGRLSYEMVLKCARAGIPLICSVSAPTALGVQVGLQTGVTMVGFLRGESFNVYSHPERVAGE